VGQLWTIFVPMNKSLTEIDFLVPLAVYIKACSRGRQYCVEDKVCMRKATFHSKTGANASETVESQHVSAPPLSLSPHPARAPSSLANLLAPTISCPGDG
jgi:hypothetical protein